MIFVWNNTGKITWGWYFWKVTREVMKYHRVQWHPEVHEAQPSVLQDATRWYFITSSVTFQDIQRVVDKKTNEASAELVFLSTTRWISHQIERVGKQREESIKPPAEGEWFYAFLELFANEFNLVEKPPHARDFRSSILELYHNRNMRAWSTQCDCFRYQMVKCGKWYTKYPLT